MVTPNLGFITPVESQASKTVTIANALTNLDKATQGDTPLTITGATTVTADEFTLGFSLELSGTPGSAFDLTVPSTKRFFRVENGSDAIATVKTASGTTVAVGVGNTALLYCDGANISEEGGGGGGGSLTIEEEGSAVVAGATTIDFKGAGVTAVDDGGNQAGVTIPGVESLEGGSSKVTGTSALDFAAIDFDITDGGSGTTDIALADQSLETKVQRITTDQTITGSPEQIQWNDEILDEFAGHDNSTDNEQIVIGTNIVDVQAKIALLSVAANAITTARIVRFNSADALQEVVAESEAEDNQQITLLALNVRGGAAGDYLVVDLASTDSSIDVDRTGSFFLVRKSTGGGASSLQPPTRTTVTLSGASTSVSIPLGVTRFHFVSEQITLTNDAGIIRVKLFHTGDTVNQLLNLSIEIVTTAANLSFSTSNNAIIAVATGSSSTVRAVAGNVYSPRDNTRKTLTDCFGYNFAHNDVRHRNGVAAAAEDDDTIRFETDAGTITGSIHIEWFYN